MRYSMTRLIVLLSVLAIPTYSWAACVVIDIGSLTIQQRGKLSAAAHRITSPVTMRWLVNNNPATTQAQATHVDLCAADVSKLTINTLNTHLSDITSEQITEDTAIAQTEATKAEASTEVSTNNLCTATLAQIVSRIDAAKATIQTDIDSTVTLLNARTALTTMNNQYAEALKKIAKCMFARSLAN